MESDSKQAKVQTYPGVVSSHKFQNFLRTHMAFVFHSGSHLRMQTSNCLVIMGSLFIMFFFFYSFALLVYFLEFVIEYKRKEWLEIDTARAFPFLISSSISAGHSEVLLTYMALSKPQERLPLAWVLDRRAQMEAIGKFVKQKQKRSLCFFGAAVVFLENAVPVINSGDAATLMFFLGNHHWIRKASEPIILLFFF